MLLLLIIRFRCEHNTPDNIWSCCKRLRSFICSTLLSGSHFPEGTKALFFPSLRWSLTVCLNLFLLSLDRATTQQCLCHYPVGGPFKPQSGSPTATSDFLIPCGRSHSPDYLLPVPLMVWFRYRDGFQLEPVRLTANPPPGLIAHDLTPSCPDVLVTWESGGQMRQLWHPWVNVSTNVGLSILIFERLNNSAYFSRGDLFSCSHLWEAVYFKPLKGSLQKLCYPYILSSLHCFRKLWYFQHITPHDVAHETEQCHINVPIFASGEELLQCH